MDVLLPHMAAVNRGGALGLLVVLPVLLLLLEPAVLALARRGRRADEGAARRDPTAAPDP